MNIYRFELRGLIKSTLIWIFSLSAACVFMMAVFPAYSDSADMIRSMVSGFPPSVMKALGLDIETVFSVTGYYSFLMVYISLAGGVQAASLGIGIISREIREKSSDFLFTKPVRRFWVVTAKLCAALTALVATNLVYSAVSYFICAVVSNGEFSPAGLLLISATMFFIQLVFVCMGAAVAVLIRIKSVNSASLVLTLIFFALSMAESIAGKKGLKFITPFKYFDTVRIAVEKSYQILELITVFAVCAVCVAVVYLGSIRRDIPSA